MCLSACQAATPTDAEPTPARIFIPRLDGVLVLDEDLQVVDEVKLGAFQVAATLIPPGDTIAALAPIHLPGPRRITKLFAIDTDTLECRSLGTLDDIPVWLGSGSHRLVTHPSAPHRVGVIEGDGLPPGQTLEVFHLPSGRRTSTALPGMITRAGLIRRGSGPLRAIAASRQHKIHEVDTEGGTIRDVATGPFAPPRRPGQAFLPLRGFQVDADSNRALCFYRTGAWAAIDLGTGSVEKGILPIPDAGLHSFVEGVRYSHEAGLYAIGVLARGHRKNHMGQIHLLDRDFQEVGKILGASFWDLRFSSRGDALVIVDGDGALERYAVPSGKLLKKGKLPGGADAIAGYR